MISELRKVTTDPVFTPDGDVLINVEDELYLLKNDMKLIQSALNKDYASPEVLDEGDVICIDGTRLEKRSINE